MSAPFEASGTVGPASLSRLLGQIHAARATGTLVVEHEGGVSRGHFRDGFPVGVNLFTRFKPLGQYLLEIGWIDIDALERSLGEVARTQRPQGRILVELGYLTEGKLAIALRRQQVANVGTLLAVREGTYRFEEGTALPGWTEDLAVGPHEAVARFLVSDEGSAAVDALLAELGSGPLVLSRLWSDESRRFELPERELGSLDAFRMPTPLAEVESAGGLERGRLRAVAAAAACFGLLGSQETVDRSASASAAANAPAPSAPAPSSPAPNPWAEAPAAAQGNPWAETAPAAPEPAAGDPWAGTAPAAPEPAAGDPWAGTAPAAPEPAAGDPWAATAPAMPDATGGDSWASTPSAAPQASSGNPWAASPGTEQPPVNDPWAAVAASPAETPAPKSAPPASSMAWSEPAQVASASSEPEPEPEPVPEPQPSAPAGKAEAPRPRSDDAALKARRSRLLKRAIQNIPGAERFTASGRSASGDQAPPTPPPTRAPPAAKQAGPDPKAARPEAPAPAPDAEAKALIREIDSIADKIEKSDLYRRLGIERTDALPKVKAAYLLLAKRYHPDRLGALHLPPDTTAKAKRIFAAIQEAYETLTRPERRADYDRMLQDDRIQGDRGRARKLAEAEVNYRKGDALFKKKDYAGAIKYLEMAVQADPDNGVWLVSLTWARFNVGPREKVMAPVTTALAKATQMKQGADLAHYYLGLIARMKDDNTRAARHFEQAVDLNPRLMEAQTELRVARRRLQKDGQTGARKLMGKMFGKD